ncbi:tripartite tricarboxylate transporter permease [Ancylobacter mangrovi]|uniref:Tripartite tricarboxylate transporter permease n=1 Tax=Ancylobacter mangrovi TaxID=2972472 RepID=A0A9X2PHV1_9HYPH|nr:tripartite tricarboxylate transporter permease [Ancylobacter mangrovi]MCS0497704.1 tripartite tricarboxylate transporter permease [Ancylobacter mangrovi]MCS0503273.1 tripartite tricarboxylate transporter permease [Ancylobacter mangrovi]
MDALSHLVLGMTVALTPMNIAYCFVGCLLGTLIGVLPGLGPVPTIAMLLPLTFNLPPETSLIMLAGIYYGAQYGGSVSAILVNLPGESTSVVTCIDGYQMARQGRAGPALGISAIGSFFAGCVAALVMFLFAPLLSKVALSVGPTDYFSMMVLGLISAVVLASGSLLKAVGMVILGVLLGTVGTDLNTGMRRFTFDILSLSDGIDFVIIAVGLFAFAEILANLAQGEKREVFTSRLGRVLPSRDDIRQAAGAIVRGTFLGSLLGVLPGGGALLASFASYTVEKKIARDPSRFGRGAIEGVAAPESANNAGAQTSMVPLLTLGIPPNAVMALMLGALTIQGITPGPQVMNSDPRLFWGLIASLWIGNIILVILNLPLIGIWIRLLRVPYRMLFPAILLFCCIGVYSINHEPNDLLFAAVFGAVGYGFAKVGCEPAPLLLGFILGPLMEENLRRALLLSRGDAAIFITEPLSAALLAAALILLVVVAAPSVRRRREAAFQE